MFTSFYLQYTLGLLFVCVHCKVVLCCWMARLLKSLETGSSQVKQHRLVMTSGTSLATMSWSALSGEHLKLWEMASTLQMSKLVCVRKNSMFDALQPNGSDDRICLQVTMGSASMCGTGPHTSGFRLWIWGKRVLFL